MEKRISHYSLDQVKLAVTERGALAFTRSSREGLRDMGLSLDQALLAIATLKRSDFHKSMTTHADTKLWQDVYRANTPAGLAYVKFTWRSEGAIVISFKRL